MWRKRLRGILYAIVVLGGGCMTPGGSVAVDIEERAWSGPAILSLNNDDTLALYDVVLFMRCDPRFRNDTLTLRVELFTPDSLHFSEAFLFSPTGRAWPVSMLARLEKLPPGKRAPVSLEREISAFYRRRVRFRRPGDYRFVITPCRHIEGVGAVGIHIESSK